MSVRSRYTLKNRIWIVLAIIIALSVLIWLIRYFIFDQTAITQVSAEDNSFILSLNNGEFVKGSKTILATGPDSSTKLKLMVDGVRVPVKPVMEVNALLTLEASNIEGANGYKDSVWFNGKLIYTFDKNIGDFTKITIPVPANLMKIGDNQVSFRSGNQVSPEDETGEHDDWRFRALKFELSDGSVLEDPDYKTATIYTVGDGSPASRLAGSLKKDFSFEIKQEKFRSSFYIWNTLGLPEGSHKVELIADGSGANKAKTVTVQVDNTPPDLVIVSPVDGRTYKNKVNVSIQSSDAGSGVDSPVAKLDGKALELPADLLTSELAVGDHKIEVIATDKVGNEKTAAATFHVLDETPEPPVVAAPADRSIVPAGNVPLSVKVSDATNDSMNVSFYKAERYDLAQPGLHQAFTGSADREPPQVMQPAGEAPFNPDQRSLTAARDGQYLIKDDKERFPYHRFSFEVGGALPNDAEIVWTGHSLPGRLVTLYAWNHEKSVWDDLDAGKGTDDFTLRGKIIPAYVNNGRVEVLVQDRIPAAGEYDFAFLWMSDTQYYSESFPKIYDLMTQWTVDHWKEKKFSYMIHTGDIVNNWNSKIEWENADRSMKILDDAHIPYGVLAGNHDVAYDAGIYDEYWKYFGKDRFLTQPTFGGDLDNNRDHYDLISVNGNDFVVVYLGWVIDDKAFAWADGILKKYEDRNAIIAVHEYLKPNKAYYGQGKDIWEKLVKPNSNVFMVLGGHNPGVAYNVKKFGDRTVLELLSDYQNGPEGGQGFMRFLQFDLNHKKLLVNTYSPYLNKENFFKPEDDEFSLPLNLKPIEKQVATDYIGIYARTNERIGTAEKVPSGSNATITYDQLSPGQTYDWYVIAKDDFGGQRKSEVWSFGTK